MYLDRFKAPPDRITKARQLLGQEAIEDEGIVIATKLNLLRRGAVAARDREEFTRGLDQDLEALAERLLSVCEALQLSCGSRTSLREALVAASAAPARESMKAR